MAKALYYHNPKCSKSRQGLALLEEKGISFAIKEYLKEGVSREELQSLFNKLGPEEQKTIIRYKEKVIQGLDFSGKNPHELSLDEWIPYLVKHPILLERPLLVTEKSVTIGRPPEKLL